MAASTPLEGSIESPFTPSVAETLEFDDDTLRAIAEVYMIEGNKEYLEKDFNTAIYFYTEGIRVYCKDEELNAKLYSNRATAHFCLGKFSETLSDASCC